MEAVICSEVMRKLMTMVERIAKGKAAVLITGETGTGKELIARAVHFHSLRSSKPWVDVNCAALPEHLVESELFGYEKGAFSGADTAKPGLFELANGGTLFFDEIGELEPKIQVKLLRVLDGIPYYRLGGSRKVSVDVRLITATNQPLDEAVRTGRFRSDLFHRLSQIQLKVPPLRERPDDVLALADYFLREEHPGSKFSFDATQILTSYVWPGNVRELRNVVMRAATVADGKEVHAADLPVEITGPAAASPKEVAAAPPAADLEGMERQAIISALSRSGGHQGMAADELGISRRTLSRKLKQYRAEAGAAGSPLGILGASEKHYFRAMVNTPVSVTTERGQHLTVKTVNVSAGGIAVEGVDKVFKMSGALTLQLDLPGNGPHVEAVGQLVWADAHGKAGIRFAEIAPEILHQLKTWLLQKQREEGWEPEA